MTSEIVVRNVFNIFQMYCSQSQEGQGDFASFTIKDEYAEFR